MKRLPKILLLSLCLMFPSISKAQNNEFWIETIPVPYDFEQDGIYYKFAPVPDGSYIDTSYKDSEGNVVKDGFYTGLEEEGDILWITGNAISHAYRWNENYTIPAPECFISFNESYYGDVYIPDSVVYNGITYAVKGLAKEAFRYRWHPYSYYGNVIISTSLNSLRLPETLEYIEEEAFYNCDQLPIDKLPKSLKYIGENAFLSCTDYDASTNTHKYKYLEIPDNVLYMGNLGLNNDGYVESFKYPQNAIYAGQQNFSSCDKIIYPSKMKHLVNLIIWKKKRAKPSIVIPDNGVFYIHQYGLPRNTKTIYSYAPIIKDSCPRWGLRIYPEGYTLEITMYVLPGLKEAYAKEWPSLLAGGQYTKDGQSAFYDEDHIIEVSREEMDAMVEAAGLTVPTAVSEVEVNPSRKVEEAIYTLDGRRWSNLQKGMNIVRQSDGTTKKVYVR